MQNTTCSSQIFWIGFKIWEMQGREYSRKSQIVLTISMLACLQMIRSCLVRGRVLSIIGIEILKNKFLTDLKKLSNWNDSNALHINASETKIMSFETTNQLKMLCKSNPRGLQGGAAAP